jgi:hypothetical protein
LDRYRQHQHAVRGDRSEDNFNERIVHEISYAAEIRNNTVRRNGTDPSTNWLWGAGIRIHASPNVEVYGNTVQDNANGIVVIQQAPETGRYSRWEVHNLWVHDNVIQQHLRHRSDAARPAAS